MTKDIDRKVFCLRRDLISINIVNLLRSTSSFWSTTGIFPQEIILGLKEEMRVAEVKLVGSASKNIQ